MRPNLSEGSAVDHIQFAMPEMKEREYGVRNTAAIEHRHRTWRREYQVYTSKTTGGGGAVVMKQTQDEYLGALRLP